MRQAPLQFARWRCDFPSGGNRYDDELAAGLRARGLDLQESFVPGAWPVPGDGDRARFADVLAVGQDWLVNNILGSAAPEVISDAVAQGHRVALLVHYFPGDDSSLSASDRERLAAGEATAVLAASHVVVTSSWAAGQVLARYGRRDVVVAEPGVDVADVAAGSLARGLPPALLWLSRLTPDKDPLTFVDALSRLADLVWTAQLVGPDTVDEALAREVRERIAEAGLSARIDVAGPKHGAALKAYWAGADLLVHTSRAETYGMVVSEALSRGIPAVVAAGTAAVEAQASGITFPPGDSAALATALRSWLADGELRQRWRADAKDARAHLQTWENTAHVVASMWAGRSD